MKKTTKKTPPLTKEHNATIKRLKFVQAISQKISEKKPLRKLLDEIIDSCKTLLNAEAASLLLFDRKDKRLYFHTVFGKKSSKLKSKSLKVGEGIAGWVASKRKSLIINDCYSDPRFNNAFDFATGFKTRNMICAPMIKDNFLVGVIQVINKRGRKPFDKQDLDLFETLASQCAVAIENARLIEVEIHAQQLKYEMETARKIQQRFIPTEFPKFNDLDVNIKLIPAKEVGGDYFYVIKIDSANTLFIVADVTGKSVPAALIVSTLYSYLHFYLVLNKDIFQIKDFVEGLNKFLVSSTSPDKFVTAWFGLYHHPTKTLLSVNAGHNPTYLIRSNTKEFNELNNGGLMLGSLDLEYTYDFINLKAGDLIAFYTDGVTEAMNKKGTEYGETRFRKILLDNFNKQVEELTDSVLKDIKEHIAGHEQSDDITLGLIRVK